MLGYEGRPSALSGDWFLTGELVRLAADGAVAYVGRADDQMNALGYRVHPSEVEAAMASLQAVAECAAAEYEPRPDVVIIAAHVVLKAGFEPRPDLASALSAHAAERLAAYKRPREIIFQTELPRTARGKLMRNALPRRPHA